jgi:uncharacterized membrane protein
VAEPNSYSELAGRLSQLIAKQNEMSKEIVQLRDALKATKLKEQAQPTKTEKAPLTGTSDIYVKPTTYQEQTSKPQENKKPKRAKNFEIKSELEKFIGENLINKIGIIILVIGVAIGAKYSIDHNLINPLTRIILGYLAGGVLLGFGIKLKTKYDSFSAVLVSGAMAILYFITFFAYDFYGLIPQILAFVLMVVLTLFTVVAALQYNRQVIALIGLIGAYAVPVLLSNGSGNVLIFFTYIAIVNAGLMVIAVKRDWKPLFYAAFVLTWLVFTNWLFTAYQTDLHFVIALVFATLFFAEFYITFLAYKLVTNSIFLKQDVVLILINSFLFFGLGLYILSTKLGGDDFFGLFAVINALLHFVVSYIIYNKKLADKNLFYLIAGLVLVFITIAIPIQLDGNWVTLLWIGETALLFWIGRTKNQPIYESLSYILIAISVFSLGMDWQTAYYSHANAENTKFASIINVHFLSALLFVGALAFISFINYKHPIATENSSTNKLAQFSQLVPVLFILGLFFLFYNEIGHYWDLRMENSTITSAVQDEYYNYNYSQIHPSFDSYKAVWLLNYLLLFVSIFSLASEKTIAIFRHKKTLFYTLIAAILAFLTLGLYEISELRENYLNTTETPFVFGKMHLYVRYISYLLVGFALFALSKLKSKDTAVIFEMALFSSIIWIASSELLHWMDLAGNHQSYKLALSILWGCYSLVIVAFGIWKNKKHLRIGAIALFGATLIKLFLYDITHLDTIAKTIVFVSLGVLLLIISFLYNKNKHRIFDEE